MDRRDGRMMRKATVGAMPSLESQYRFYRTTESMRKRKLISWELKYLMVWFTTFIAPAAAIWGCVAFSAAGELNVEVIDNWQDGAKVEALDTEVISQ